MKKTRKTGFFILFLFLAACLGAQGLWDEGYDVIQTAEGGYAVIGFTDSYTNGFLDFLVYKLDASGQKQWRKNYGGMMMDRGYHIEQTGDGGYILTGCGDTYTHGTTDFLVYKIDASGRKQWRKNFGGMAMDFGLSAAVTSDGGVIVAGYSRSYSHGMFDFLAYKLNGAGQKQWRKNFGGNLDDRGTAVIQTSDGGYALVGDSSTYSNGMLDLLVYKLDAAGNKQWRKNYGGSKDEWAHAHMDVSHRIINQTPDGGYILCGWSTTYSSGLWDFLVYKLDAGGNKQWRKNYGSSGNEIAPCVFPTPDGGYIVGGSGDSYTYTNGGMDMLAYKLDAAGNKQWRKNYGGFFMDFGRVIRPTADGGYIFCGSTDNFGNSPPNKDFILYKLDASGNKQWRKNYGK